MTPAVTAGRTPVSGAPQARVVVVPSAEHSALAQDFSTTGIVIDVDGQRVVSTGSSVGTGEYWWETFHLDGGSEGRIADLTFSNDQGVYWKIQALVLH